MSPDATPRPRIFFWENIKYLPLASPPLPLLLFIACLNDKGYRWAVFMHQLCQFFRTPSGLFVTQMPMLVTR